MDHLISIIENLQQTGTPKLLIIIGFVFLFLAFVGKFGGYIELPQNRQKFAGIIGALLLFIGIALSSTPMNISSQPSKNNEITNVSRQKNEQSISIDKPVLSENLSDSEEPIEVYLASFFPDAHLIPNTLIIDETIERDIREVAESYQNPDEIEAFLINANYKSFEQTFGFSGFIPNNGPSYLFNYITSLNENTDAKKYLALNKKKIKLNSEIAFVNDNLVCGQESFESEGNMVIESSSGVTKSGFWIGVRCRTNNVIVCRQTNLDRWLLELRDTLVHQV